MAGNLLATVLEVRREGAPNFYMYAVLEESGTGRAVSALLPSEQDLRLGQMVLVTAMQAAGSNSVQRAFGLPVLVMTKHSVVVHVRRALQAPLVSNISRWEAKEETKVLLIGSTGYEQQLFHQVGAVVRHYPLIFRAYF